MKNGYYTYGYEMLPIEESLEHIARLGFDGIELCTLPGYSTNLDLLYRSRVSEIKARVESLGLELAALGAHTSLLEAEPERQALNLARLKRNVDLAAELGAPVIDTFSGRAPDGWPEERAWEVLAEGVADLASYAQENGILIGFEPHINMLVDSPAKMLHLVELVSSPSLRVNLDISHFAVLGDDIGKVVRELAPYTVHTHVKDTRGRHPSFEFLIPGEGDFDFVGFIRAMKENGYQGFITSEISVMRRRRPGYDPFHAAELSYRTVARALREAGA